MTARMAVIPDSERPTLFRRLDHAALSDWVVRARRFLRLEYGEEVEFVSSRDNQWGADLQVRPTGQMIELKSGGPVTDANAGVSTVAWALGDSGSALKRIMSESMKDRRQLYLDGDTRGVHRSKRQTMEQLIEYLRQHLTISSPAPLRLQHYMRCVAMGITTRKEIERLEGRERILDSAPRILHADLPRGWRSEEHAFEEREAIVVERIDMSDPSLESDVPRVTLMLRGLMSGRMGKIYPHYKNSYRLKTGGKIPANCWVQTACFHVWIGTETR